jgi:acyl dehydratase
MPTDVTQSCGFEAAGIGDAIPSLTKVATNLSTFLVGIAWWTSHRIHYDKDEAIREGFDDVVVPGIHIYMWIEQHLVDWAGQHAALKRLTIRHKALPYVNDEITISGEVSSVEDRLVTVDIRALRADGTELLAGTAKLARN